MKMGLRRLSRRDIGANSFDVCTTMLMGINEEIDLDQQKQLIESRSYFSRYD